MAAAALLVGAGIDVSTWLVARYGPESGSGEPWSFRGNGAIVVPFGMGPAILADLWTSLVLRARSARRWRQLGLAAGGVGLALLLAGIVAVMLFGVAGIPVSGWLLVAALVWMVAAPLRAVFAPVPVEPRPQLARGLYVIAGALFAVLLVVGFFVMEQVLPPGS
jgi:hypothetical protein